MGNTAQAGETEGQALSFSGSGLNLAQPSAPRSSHSHHVLKLLLRVPTCQGWHSCSRTAKLFRKPPLTPFSFNLTPF